ncbi:MAG: hypothetical protein H7839_15730 [Magnetococcus sp. YQC-5]
MEKPKLAMYWASGCGGCEMALVNIHEHILDVAAAFDFFFCPCLLDTKYQEVEEMADETIAITFFNGAIRSSENEEMAHLLRRKSQLLIAFGSCAHAGCIPGLSHFSTRSDHFQTIYLDNPSLDNPTAITPQTEVQVPEGILTLPYFMDKVKTLGQVVEVDYTIPGCPPEAHQIWNVMDHLIEGRPLPPKGSVLGAGRSSVCNECNRVIKDKKIKRLYRNYELVPDATSCLLEQGLLCMGSATRDGCGGLCPMVNMPCTGCYGTPEGVLDQGAKMASALGSMLDIGETRELTEESITHRMDEILNTMPDLAGTFYKYSLAGSILGGRKAQT